METVLVEGFDPDALALARFLAAGGHDVRVASDCAAPAEATALGQLGIRVEAGTSLDDDPGPADVAYLDVWTPEVAPRVQRLRAQGSRISCLGDLLLWRWGGPTLGITGTAGKTTTTALVAEILRAAGIEIAVSRGARAGNLWPTADLLERLERGGSASRSLLLLELTSSHLAFMHRSPSIAAVISFWPDHLELHGDLAHYRAAKETIVRYQRQADIAIVNGDDASADFAAATEAGFAEFSLEHPVEHGAYLDPTRGLVLASQGSETALGPLPAAVGAAHPGNVVAAAAIAAVAGASPAAVEQGIRAAAGPPWRAQPQGSLDGVPVIDDGMAATPGKAAATLAAHPAGSVVLIAGGMLDAGGGPVHAAPEEQALLERACDEIARTIRIAVVFGEAGPRLAGLLRSRGVAVVEVGDLDDAVTDRRPPRPGCCRGGLLAALSGLARRPRPLRRPRPPGALTPRSPGGIVAEAPSGSYFGYGAEHSAARPRGHRRRSPGCRRAHRPRGGGDACRCRCEATRLRRREPRPPARRGRAAFAGSRRTTTPRGPRARPERARKGLPRSRTGRRQPRRS